MRIIAGTARGRRLKAPRGAGTRPTSDRLKEALFSIVESRADLAAGAVLDLYAGSGALALEALSRGAPRAVLVDYDIRCQRAITDNTRALGFAPRCRVLCEPVTTALGRLERRGERFALIVADPPYDLDPRPLIEGLATRDLLESAGLFVVEHRRQRSVPPRCGELVQAVSRVYGDGALTLFQRETPGADSGQEA